MSMEVVSMNVSVISGFRQGVNEILDILCVTLRRSVVDYPPFGTTCLPHLQGSSWTLWPLKMGQIACPETSVTANFIV